MNHLKSIALTVAIATGTPALSSDISKVFIDALRTNENQTEVFFNIGVMKYVYAKCVTKGGDYSLANRRLDIAMALTSMPEFVEHLSKDEYHSIMSGGESVESLREKSVESFCGNASKFFPWLVVRG